MKILKYILFAILGLVLIFLAFGWTNPSVSYGHEITVNKSVKEAWAVTQDESKFAQWLEGYKSIELIEGEQDAIGSKYKVLVNPGGDQPDFEMTQTLADLKEFEYVKLDYESDVMDFKQTISYKESEGTTTVTSDSKVIGKNIITRSIFAIMEFFGGGFTKQETKNFEALKKLIEENTTDYYPAPVIMELEDITPEQDSE